MAVMLCQYSSAPEHYTA